MDNIAVPCFFGLTV